jgi:hypothetical protein
MYGLLIVSLSGSLNILLFVLEEKMHMLETSLNENARFLLRHLG